MEGQAVKRRRAYSLEPNKIAEAIFVRKYVNYLVPALTKMKEKNSYKEEHSGLIKKVLKYEVDMALVLSAQGFAWSNALKLRLQREDVINVESGMQGVSSTTTKVMNRCDQNLTVTEEEEDVDEKQLRRLRSLVPGGEEICNDQQMLAELRSYIRCLQMQVNILQCLAQTQ